MFCGDVVVVGCTVAVVAVVAVVCRRYMYHAPVVCVNVVYLWFLDICMYKNK